MQEKLLWRAWRIHRRKGTDQSLIWYLRWCRWRGPPEAFCIHRRSICGVNKSPRLGFCSLGSVIEQYNGQRSGTIFLDIRVLSIPLEVSSTPLQFHSIITVFYPISLAWATHRPLLAAFLSSSFASRATTTWPCMLLLRACFDRGGTAHVRWLISDDLKDPWVLEYPLMILRYQIAYTVGR